MNLRRILHPVHTYPRSDRVGDPNLSKPVIHLINQSVEAMRKTRNLCLVSIEELTPPSFNIFDMISMYSMML